MHGAARFLLHFCGCCYSTPDDFATHDMKAPHLSTSSRSAIVSVTLVLPLLSGCFSVKIGKADLNTIAPGQAIPHRQPAEMTTDQPFLERPDPHWLDHDRDRPLPSVITPAVPGTPEQAGKSPSDAVALFDGKDLAQWASIDGTPTKWIVRDGYMECVRGSGYVRTVQNFGDCQLHVEWATPTPPHGEGQGRGNSGVFFGLDRYELQVLDSYQNKTYADGSAGSIYGQYPPLVNASLPPGEWQAYDIIYIAPRFDASGGLLSPARLTAFHNGVLIQNNVALTGPTSWLERAPYSRHPEKQPISLQDHGNPVRFRNIWVRELGRPGKKELTLSNDLLSRYSGRYERGANDFIEISEENRQLVAAMNGMRFVLFAESPTNFFAKTTDLQIKFPPIEGKPDHLVWSVGEGGGSRAARAK
jgi:hypothetical protein